MKTISKCLKEWNATVEALGQGLQTILIRKYKTNLNGFLFYPTVSYTVNDNYLNFFQDKFHDFVEENKLPKKENGKIEIKYYGRVENIIIKPSSRVKGLKNLYTWTPEHVKSYLNNEKAYVWILRVYKLEKPYMVNETLGRIYTNLKEEISLEGLKPVINDDEFSKIINEI